MGTNDTVTAAPLRVAHIIHCLRLGGLEQMVVELASRGRERGIEPLLIALGDDGDVRKELEKRHIPLIWLGDQKGMSRQLLVKLGEALDLHRIHVAHAHDLGPWLNTVGSRVWRPKTKILATFHQLAPPKGPKLQVASLAARLSTALVACGNEVRAELESWVPNSARLETIGNGVPLPAPASEDARRDARKRLGLPEDVKVIGYVGRLHEEKGPHTLVKAFLARFANRSDVRLVLVGTGPMEEELRQLAAGHENVHLPGQVMGASSLLPAFDIYAQMSRREGRSLAMLEAMAAGLPTVAHDLPAVAEIHIPGKTALLPKLGNLDAVSNALETLIKDGNRRSAMAKAARERAKLYSIDSMMDAYEALYRESVKVSA